MTTTAWGVTIVTFALALLPGILARGRWERVVLLVVPVLAGLWLIASTTIFGTREQLYGGGTLVMMGLLPAILGVYALAIVGAGQAVTRIMRSLQGRWAVALGIVTGVTVAIAIPLALAISGLASAA